LVPRRSFQIILLGVVASLAAACGGETRTDAGATSEVAPATTAAATSTQAPVETTKPTGGTGGSCAEQLQPESVEAIACSWIADADPVACESMSDELLSTLFGRSGTAGIESCEEQIADVRPADDKRLVGFEEPLLEGERATLALIDQARSPKLRYTLTFVRRDGRWLIDASEHVEAAPEGATTEPSVSPEDAAAAGEIKELVTVWYAEANPAVCDFMTDEMLEFGWGKTGDEGRELCRTNLEKADPQEHVSVRRPRVSGDTAEVEVEYGLDDERQFDRVSLVRRNDEWLVDGVVLAGFVSE
jgi:hypothetical protein